MGLCVDCSGKSTNGVYCQMCHKRHLESNRAKLKLRSDNKLCLICGLKREQTDKTKCNHCLKKTNDYMLNRRNCRVKNSKCIGCGINSDKKRCTICYLKMISVNIFGSVDHHNNLLELFNKQNGKCVYTGRQLYFQENCELDHIIPVSKNGQNKIENLQWLHRDINKMKHSLNQGDFLTTIFEISNYVKTSFPYVVTKSVCSN